MADPEVEVGGLVEEMDGLEEEVKGPDEGGWLAGPDEVLGSTVEGGCLPGPEEVDGPVHGGSLAVPVEMVFGGDRLVSPDGPVDGGGLAVPVEVVFGGGHLVGTDEVDGPEEAEDGPAEQALAGLFVFLAWLTIRFATAVERILMASPIFFSACSLAFFFCRWS